MFEKQFDLKGWMGDLEGGLAEAPDFPEAIEEFASFLGDAGGAYRDATSNTERRRELAFMLHLAARLNQYLATKLIAETPD